MCFDREQRAQAEVSHHRGELKSLSSWQDMSMAYWHLAGCLQWWMMLSKRVYFSLSFQAKRYLQSMLLPFGTSRCRAVDCFEPQSAWFCECCFASLPGRPGKKNSLFLARGQGVHCKHSIHVGRKLILSSLRLARQNLLQTVKRSLKVQFMCGSYSLHTSLWTCYLCYPIRNFSFCPFLT